MMPQPPPDFALTHPQKITASGTRKKETVVKHLPGFNGSLPFSLQTGYVEVDNSHLFYYFAESERNPAEDPVLLWLTGGPGCSAFHGLVYEIGFSEKPFSKSCYSAISHNCGPVRHLMRKMCFESPSSYVEDGLPKLVYRPDSSTKAINDKADSASCPTASRALQAYFLWHSVLSLPGLFVLAGGYTSHTPPTHSPPVPSHPQTQTGRARRQRWTSRGESRRGWTVEGPRAVNLQAEIKYRNGRQPILNLKGYVIGNPLTDRKFDVPSKVPYAHGMGHISDEQYEMYKESCSSDTTGITRSVQCENCHDAINKCLKDINTQHILEPKCSSSYKGNSDSSSSSSRMTLEYSSADLNLSEISSECRGEGYSLSGIWANNGAVRAALGVHKGTVPLWLRCNFGMPYTKEMRSSVEYHRSLTSRGYRSLIYSDDHDMIVPFIGTQTWIRSLGFSIVD
ncbi:hypothetical protein BRADI_3g21565v3 [Brachypodium distachyon]|uniref:Uncharacterized protein n=1 Tax=Brachypodium distachyon TaxID=15368 RepID=A0A0Q3LV53_BRADI|nr:hypothetical protein BRADI_3g21565v3 [Brachypodium distachyon]